MVKDLIQVIYYLYKENESAFDIIDDIQKIKEMEDKNIMDDLYSKYSKYSLEALHQEKAFILHQINYNELSDEQHNKTFDDLQAINHAIFKKQYEED